MQVIGSSRLLAAACVATLLAGCGSIPTSGPSADRVESSRRDAADTGIFILDLSEATVSRARSLQRRASFAQTFGSGTDAAYRVGAGDELEVAIWEAPPAALFVAAMPSVGARTNTGNTRESLPTQMVASDGHINVPFVGPVRAAGRTLHEIEQDIANQLKGKAHQPQVLLRVARNVSSNVTIVGEVTNSTRLPLTAKGERLLDALAAAGGVRQPVGKVTLQVTRELVENGSRVVRVQSLPLDAIIVDPAQNIRLMPGDVITALHVPNSLIFLGAATKNEEINFEAQGITLAQALGRAGGLQDQRANPAGVFIFRWEDPAMLGELAAGARTNSEGRVPVIYKVDLRDPATFFTAQSFPMRNGDVLYVANAPAAELQKFVNIIGSVVIPTVTIQNLTR